MANNANNQEEKGIGEWFKIRELNKTSIPLDKFVEQTRPYMKNIYEETIYKTDDENEKPEARKIPKVKEILVAYEPSGGKVGKKSEFLKSCLRGIHKSGLGEELIEIVNRTMLINPDKEKYRSFENFHEKPKFTHLAREFGCAVAAPIRQILVPGIQCKAFGAVVILWDKNEHTIGPDRRTTDMLSKYASYCYKKLAVTLLKQFVWLDSKCMERVEEQVDHFAETAFSILIIGERGTGKTALATEIHRRSKRPADLFWTIPCSTYSSDVFEVILFGCIKGAFTDAKEDRRGVVEQYNGGTVFLDEIGSLAPSTQEKLLHFLQTKTYKRYGDTKTKQSDVRLIFATNESLPSLIKSRPDGRQKLRRDFVDRIVGLTIVLPPLRKRIGHVGPLAHHFLTGFNDWHGTNIQLAKDGLEQIKKELFKKDKGKRKPYEGGNIHILEKCLETAFAKARYEKHKEITSGDIAYGIGQMDQAWEEFSTGDER